MQGECFLVNFADDFVAGFQYKSEAERYYKELKERMEKFGLELESSKSRLIEFGRFAEQNRRARGECTSTVAKIEREVSYQRYRLQERSLSKRLEHTRTGFTIIEIDQCEK